MTKKNQEMILHPDCMEVTLIRDLYTYKDVEDSNGDIVQEMKLIKKNSRSKKTIWIDAVDTVDEILNKQGLPYKSKCQINFRQKDDPTVIVGKYEDIRNKIFEYKKIQVGFKI